MAAPLPSHLLHKISVVLVLARAKGWSGHLGLAERSEKRKGGTFLPGTVSIQ